MKTSKRKILFITFDSSRHDYPTITYSVATILASLKEQGIIASHYPINIQQIVAPQGELDISEFIYDKPEFNHNQLPTITDVITDIINNAISYFKKFEFIAIGLTRWSIEYTKKALESLNDFQGKIILGGYEVTAMDENDLLREYPRVDFFIKGYAEKAIAKLLKNKLNFPTKFIYEPLDMDYLFSPYSNGIINPISRKIYWETKRGCSSRCGFCEWGNAKNELGIFKSDHLKKDIELFSKTNIEEINILDGTFNDKNNYHEILAELLEKTDAMITFQARFEALSDEFMILCSHNKDRLHLEFGLQTIHKNEMKTIGRSNNMQKVSDRLLELNQKEIEYEVSIIYAIPGQTTESFIDTIEFLRMHGCKKIMAFPLQIPRNSTMEKKIEEYKITFCKDRLNVTTVGSSHSFKKENRFDMDRIAASLNQDKENILVERKHLERIDGTRYLNTIHPKYISKNIGSLSDLIINNFMIPTANDMKAYDVIQYASFMGKLYHYSMKQNSTMLDELAQYATGHKSIQIQKCGDEPVLIDLGNGKTLDISPNTNNIKGQLNFRCKIAIGESGSIYVYRDIVDEI